MHPFVVIKVNGEKKQTNPSQNGNRNPLWSDEVTFEVNPTDEIVIQIYDQATYENGEAVAYTETTVDKLVKLGPTAQVDLPIESFGEPAGQVILSVR